MAFCFTQFFFCLKTFMLFLESAMLSGWHVVWHRRCRLSRSLFCFRFFYLGNYLIYCRRLTARKVSPRSLHPTHRFIAVLFANRLITFIYFGYKQQGFPLTATPASWHHLKNWHFNVFLSSELLVLALLPANARSLFLSLPLFLCYDVWRFPPPTQCSARGSRLLGQHKFTPYCTYTIARASTTDTHTHGTHQ